jgi:N-terminal domain of (some) glycogen debranching enzymes
MTQTPRGDVIIGEHYYILASEPAAGLPKLVLKHDEAFLVANRRGDLPALPDSEFGFYVDGTRFLRQVELRVHGQRPIVLNAGVSEDALQAGIDLTNPDVALAPEVVLPDRSLRIARRLTVHGGQLYQVLLGGGAGGELRSSRREHDRSDVRVPGVVRQAAAVAS